MGLGLKTFLTDGSFGEAEIVAILSYAVKLKHPSVFLLNSSAANARG